MSSQSDHGRSDHLLYQDLLTSDPHHPDGFGGLQEFATELPKDFQKEISRAGFFPSLVTQIIMVALGGEEPLHHLVQMETTFDETLHRHLTVLVLTPTRLITGHVDDSDDDDDAATPMAIGTTDAIPLHQIRSVGLTHVISNPATHDTRPELAELNLAVAWGGVSRLELGPATCGDPNCEGDHGYLGALVPDDLVVRVASAADGPEATAKALSFARALSAATGAGSRHHNSTAAISAKATTQVGSTRSTRNARRSTANLLPDD